MMTTEEYGNLIQQLETASPATWVVCRSKEEAYALAAWIEENFPDD